MNGIDAIDDLILEVSEIIKRCPLKNDGSHVYKWQAELDLSKKKTLVIIRRFFEGSQVYLTDLNKIANPQDHRGSAYIPEQFLAEGMCQLSDLLRAMKSDLQMDARETLDLSAIKQIGNICDRFPLVAEQLGTRHNSRTPLTINDEYDVQDIFQALLRLHFDDIVDEETMPSFAGISSRVDFILRSERIGIEIKKTRPSLGSKELRTQLSEDIITYEKHPGFNILIFFIYDRDKLIENPTGFEKDFCIRRDELNVIVFVRS